MLVTRLMIIFLVVISAASCSSEPDKSKDLTKTARTQNSLAKNAPFRESRHDGKITIHIGENNVDNSIVSSPEKSYELRKHVESSDEALKKVLIKYDESLGNDADRKSIETQFRQDLQPYKKNVLELVKEELSSSE